MFAGQKPKQPKKCKNCIWGYWDGIKQFCSKQTCVHARDAKTRNETVTVE